MADKALEHLLAQLQNGGYAQKTTEELQKQASNRYKGLYDQKRLSAQQAYETSDQALAQQLAGLQASYDKQREASAENYEKAYSQLDRQMLGRGMQRSSYNSASLANLRREGAEAQQDINDAQTAQEQNIAEQRKLASQQLSQQIAQYDASQAADELAYLDDLENREYERGQADRAMQNDLALALYNAQFQREQADREQSNWESNFNFQQTQADREQGNWQTTMDYQKAQDALAQENWQKQFDQGANQWQTTMDYQKEQDALSQENWLKQFEFEKAQADQAQANWQAEFDKMYGNKGGGSSSGGSGSSGTYTPPKSADDDLFKGLEESEKVPQWQDTIQKAASGAKVLSDDSLAKVETLYKAAENTKNKTTTPTISTPSLNFQNNRVDTMLKKATGKK